MIMLAQFGPGVPEETLPLISGIYTIGMPAAGMILLVAATFWLFR